MLALVAIFILELSFIKTFILLLLLMVLVRVSIKNNQPRTLQWQPDGAWIINQKGNKYSARLQSGSVVSLFFAALNFKLNNGKRLNIIIFKDNIDADKFRQLRVRMKVEGIVQLNDVVTLSDK